MANVYPRPGGFSLVQMQEELTSEELKTMNDAIKARVDETGNHHPNLKARIDALALREAGVNEYSVVPNYNAQGQLTTVEELDGIVVKKRTTMAYHPDGTVNTVTEELEGTTVVTTMNYVNGAFDFVSKEVFEGGL